MSEEYEDVCQNCVFYREASSGRHGFCKRYPPVFTECDGDGKPRFFNPVVGPNNWCGEWEEKE